MLHLAQMKIIAQLLNKERKVKKELRILEKDSRSEVAKKQFQILVDRGLNVPVAYL